MKHTLSIAGIGLLGGLAVAGWMPRPSMTPVEAAPAAPVVATVASGFQAPEFQTVANRRAYTNQNVRRAPARAYRNDSDRYNERYGDRRVQEERSTGKSIAIVGGSAAAGAAIGGIAGGGKGAALGAITGGTAGFIYDRLTKDKR